MSFYRRLALFIVILVGMIVLLGLFPVIAKPAALTHLNHISQSPVHSMASESRLSMLESDGYKLAHRSGTYFPLHRAIAQRLNISAGLPILVYAGKSEDKWLKYVDKLGY